MFTNLQTKIEYLLSTHRVVVLRTNGLVWQESFVKQLAVGRRVYDLENPLLRQQATYRREEFLSALNVPALLLDVQYVDGLLADLIDNASDNGSFLVVVKQSYYIMEESCAEAGCAVYDLPLAMWEGRLPFALNALQSKLVVEDVYDKILTGYFTAEEQQQFLKRFLQYDLKDFTVCSDDLKFYRFMCCIAACSGNVVNYAQLGKLVDVSSPTAKQWLKYLEGAGLVVLLPTIEHENLQRLTKAPKLYFRDTGLACKLLNINSKSDLLNSNLLNALFETWVVMQLREACLQNGAEQNLCYSRDSNAKEINLLMECEGVLHPVEIKRDVLNVKKIQKKFRVFREQLAGSDVAVGEGLFICDGKEPLDLGQSLWQVPVGLL